MMTFCTNSASCDVIILIIIIARMRLEASWSLPFIHSYFQLHIPHTKQTKREMVLCFLTLKSPRTPFHKLTLYSFLLSFPTEMRSSRKISQKLSIFECSVLILPPPPQHPYTLMFRQWPTNDIMVNTTVSWNFANCHCNTLTISWWFYPRSKNNNRANVSQSSSMSPALLLSVKRLLLSDITSKGNAESSTVDCVRESGVGGGGKGSYGANGYI